MVERPALEIAVQDTAGAAIALAEGATRVELCAALVTGGLTPSFGTIQGVAQQGIDADHESFVHVLVRPRPGGFVYDAEEIQTSVRDIRAARQAGASGVVLGALLEDGKIDRAALDQLMEAAEGMTVTFHRAIDVVPDIFEALDVLIELGVRRVLTSGQAAVSLDGAETLTRLVAQARGRLEIMAGGGVTIDAIPALLECGVDAVHLSAKALSPAQFPSGPGGGAAAYDVTDRGIVRAAAGAVALRKSR